MIYGPTGPVNTLLGALFTMSHLFELTVLIILILSVQAGATTTICFNDSANILNESYLDSYLINSKIVFVMRVNSVDKSSSQISYEAYQPAIKGEIPNKGTLNFMGECMSPLHLAENLVYIAFLQSATELLSYENAIFFLISPEQPGYRWMTEWLNSNTPNTLFPATLP
jgi:hypothetical protein